MAIKLEEKRLCPRIKLKTPLRYQIRGTPEFNNAISNDLGMCGVSFVTNKFIAPKTLLGLEVNVLSRVLNPIGRVVWSSPLIHSNRYQVGIEFLELDPREKNYLRDYMDMQMGKL